MTQMNLSTKQKQAHKHRQLTCGCQGEKSGRGKDWELGINICKRVYREWVNNKVLLYSTGKYIQNPVIQFMWKQKIPRIDKVVLRKNGAGGINFPDFRLYCKATVIKTVEYWHKQQNCRPNEQERKPKDKAMHLWVSYF